jgi:hypothetical protein
MILTSDLLSAAALALAALAVFYGLWGPELADTLTLVRVKHVKDRGKEIAQIRLALRSRALPLALANFVVAIVLLPPVVSVVVGSLHNVLRLRWASIVEYRADEALFIVVWMLICGLMAMSAKTCLALRQRGKEFRSP